MNQWAFVIAAYAVAVLGTAALLVSGWVVMRSAETRAESPRKRQ